MKTTSTYPLRLPRSITATLVRGAKTAEFFAE